MPPRDNTNHFHLQCDLSKTTYPLVKMYSKDSEFYYLLVLFCSDRILNGTGPSNDNAYALTLIQNSAEDLEFEPVVFTPWEGPTSTPTPQSWVAKG